KPDAALSFFQDASRDLDTFAALAGRGKPFQLTRALPLRRSFLRENITRELSQIVALTIVCKFSAHAPFLKFAHGRSVAGRKRDHYPRRLLNERPEKLRLDRGRKGHIEKQERHRRPCCQWRC